eukprot:763078-Hanusia_phi.AAC.4
MDDFEEVEELFFGQWKDAAICVDRFEVDTAGRHLVVPLFYASSLSFICRGKLVTMALMNSQKIEDAGKVIQCRGGEQYHGYSNFVRFSSFARTSRPMTTSGEQVMNLNYIEFEVRRGRPPACRVMCDDGQGERVGVTHIPHGRCNER